MRLEHAGALSVMRCHTAGCPNAASATLNPAYIGNSAITRRRTPRGRCAAQTQANAHNNTSSANPVRDLDSTLPATSKAASAQGASAAARADSGAMRRPAPAHRAATNNSAARPMFMSVANWLRWRRLPYTSPAGGVLTHDAPQRASAANGPLATSVAPAVTFAVTFAADDAPAAAQTAGQPANCATPISALKPAANSQLPAAHCARRLASPAARDPTPAHPLPAPAATPAPRTPA